MQFNSCRESLDKELFVRYAQASALLPMMQFSALPSCLEDEKSVSCIKEAARLHESFGEYIVELAEKTSLCGEPIVRHLAYEFPEEGFEKTSDMFMLGDRFLVAPVLKKGEKEKTVRLPNGKWKDTENKIFEGGREHTFSVDIDTVLYFEKL